MEGGADSHAVYARLCVNQSEDLALIKWHQRTHAHAHTCTHTHTGRDLDQSEDLALIKWHREGAKKTLVRKIIETGMKSEYHIFPRLVRKTRLRKRLHTLAD